MGGLYLNKSKRLFIASMSIIVVTLISVMLVSTVSAQGQDAKCRDDKGSQLYESLCASCHHSLEKSTRRGRSTSRILSAIKYQAVHDSLTELSAKDIDSIACALSEEPKDNADETSISKNMSDN